MLAAKFDYFGELDLSFGSRPGRDDQVLLRADYDDVFEHGQVPGIGDFLRFIANFLLGNGRIFRFSDAFYLWHTFSIEILHSNLLVIFVFGLLLSFLGVCWLLIHLKLWMRCLLVAVLKLNVVMHLDFERFKTVAICDVEDGQAAIGISEVSLRHWLEALLARGVPALHFYHFLVDF